MFAWMLNCASIYWGHINWTSIHTHTHTHIGIDRVTRLYMYLCVWNVDNRQTSLVRFKVPDPKPREASPINRHVRSRQSLWFASRRLQATVFSNIYIYITICLYIYTDNPHLSPNSRFKRLSKELQQNLPRQNSAHGASIANWGRRWIHSPRSRHSLGVSREYPRVKLKDYTILL